MTIPETLAEMRFLMRQRADLASKLQRAESSATSTGGMGDGMPRSNNSEPKVERYGIYIAELKSQIDNIDQHLSLYSRTVRSAISKVTEPVSAEILRLRYVDLMPVRAIAIRMHYSREYTFDKLRTAEKHLT